MSGWRKRQIRELQIKRETELYKISWTQNYDVTSLVEQMDKIMLSNTDYKEAKEVIKLIKSKL